MKSLIVIVIVCGCSQVLGQASNTNNNNSSPTIETTKKSVSTENSEEMVLDSVQVYEKENGRAEKKYKSKEGIASDKNAGQSPVFSAESVKDTQSSNSTVIQSQSLQFQNVQFSSSRNAYSRSATPVQQQQMDESVNFLNKVAPNSYQTNLFNYQSKHYNSEFYPFLKKAAEMHPDSLAVRQQLAAYYFTVNEPAEADSVVTQMIGAGNICSGQLTYATNLSSSIGATNTIIVHGFDDFLPLTHIQNTTNATYQIVSLDLMQSESYRVNLKNKGFVIPESKVVDTAFLYDFVTANASKNIQLSMTLPRYYFESFLPTLYPRGLTFVTKPEEDIDMINSELWESKWDQFPIKSGTKDIADQWSVNYLPALVAIKRYYELNGKIDEAAKVNQAIIAISERRKLEPKMKKYTN